MEQHPASKAENAACSPDTPPLFLGVLGGGCLRPGKANLRLIRRALREGWAIPEDKRLALLEHLGAVLGAGHPRNTLAAIRCLIDADRVDAREEAGRLAAAADARRRKRVRRR